MVVGPVVGLTVVPTLDWTVRCMMRMIMGSELAVRLTEEWHLGRMPAVDGEGT